MNKFISAVKTFLFYFFAIWLFIGIIIYLSVCIAYPEVRIPLIVMIVIFSFLEIICITKIVKHRKSKRNNGTFEEKNSNALAVAYNYLSNAAFSSKSDENSGTETTTPQSFTKPVSQQFESKTQQNTVSSQNFFAMQLANEIRIMNESYELASKTLNLDTFKMRYDLYLEKANLILSRTNNPQTIQRCKSLIADQNRLKARIVADLGKKALEDTKKLKTQQGIITRLESAYNELQNATFLHDAPDYAKMIAVLQKAINDIKGVSFSATYTQPKEVSPYSSFKPDYNKSIDEISADAQKHSEAMYELHQKRFSGFDPFNLDNSLVDDTPLTSVEKSFLKYMDGNNVINPYIPGYWTYEYNINYKKLLTIFLAKEYLKISSGTETLKFLTVEELKEILRKSNLKVSGKKNELIDRIKENIEVSVLETMISKSSCKYILTPSGKNLTAGITASATKNIELEDKCLQLILISEFNAAYSEICNNELSKNISRGIMNWQYESVHGLSQNQINCFKNLMSNQRIDFPDEISNEHNSDAKACVILGYMLGVAVDKIYTMFCRVTEKTYNKTIVIPFLQELQFSIMDDIQSNL